MVTASIKTTVIDFQDLEESIAQEKNRAKQALEEEKKRAQELENRLIHQKKVSTWGEQSQPGPRSRSCTQEGLTSGSNLSPPARAPLLLAAQSPRGTAVSSEKLPSKFLAQRPDSCHGNCVSQTMAVAFQVWEESITEEKNRVKEALEDEQMRVQELESLLTRQKEVRSWGRQRAGATSGLRAMGE